MIVWIPSLSEVCLSGVESMHLCLLEIPDQTRAKPERDFRVFNLER
jgi:hypothetical protein